MIRSILIDDEKFSRETLLHKLREHCPQVELLKQCTSPEEGITAIRELRPELIFLDVEMPVMDGFTMLQQISPINFEVIFTTAYNHYAVNAIRASALDYLVKPINEEDLKQAVQRFENKKHLEQKTQKQFEVFFQNIKNQQNPLNQIALPTMDGLMFVQVQEIIRLESESNYTIFYLLKGGKLVVSKTMKEYEEMLGGYHFFRVHHSHLINLDYIKKYVKGDGGYVIMSDNTSVEVSSRRKQQFFEVFNRR